MPIGCKQAFCASQQKYLDFQSRAIYFQGWTFLMSSDSLPRSFSKHLTYHLNHFVALHSICIGPSSLGQKIITDEIMCSPISSHPSSCRVFSAFYISSHLTSSLFSQPFSADQSSSHLFSCDLSFDHLLGSSELFSFNSSQRLHFKFVSTQLFQLFTALLMSGRLNSAHLSLSSQFIK